MIEFADEHMVKGRATEALAAYQEAWSHMAGQLDVIQQVWLLLSIANSAIRAGDFEEAFDALSALLEDYSTSGVVIGNPLFHLLVGLCCHGLQEDPDAEVDNFARALICGGQEMFVQEDPKHLHKIKTVLEPPAETGTWDGYNGCSRDLLNGATGYLRKMLTEKIGTPPPYQ
ncbi:tetratricopeptide repeat protein [Armatimonas rosea]|uniref:Tetratricopeptide (TPR) repeat protein n=1 Tax=Armatimonas rosea TaxID=685828 RepID=A0A7W9SNP2_ARMRO|nr:tetratricopeptide repeat protein [Armatimonas rosea]MBB6049509.1 tetratricopeptide (TPR) repeat protein [Armatimonas rosea]